MWRNLSLVYTLAGVDCSDCAVDASVENAVNEGIEAAREIVYLRKPWVMISFNDDEDLHFHKAGLLQLAGDTNSHPVEELKREGLFQTTLVSKNSKDRKLMSTLPASSHALEGGMAYSSNARK